MPYDGEDLALSALKVWIADAMCECGHLDIEHHDAPQASLRRCAECDCYHWRPVTFRVTRTVPRPRRRHHEASLRREEP